MTIEETGVIMDVLKTAYPQFYSGKNAADEVKALSLWAEMFGDDDVAMVAAAVKCFIAEDTKGFAPSIGQIKDMMARLSGVGGMDEDVAWQLLRKAVSRSGYGAQEEYDRLPEELRSMCSPGQLHEWSQMDASVFNSVIASHFRKAYRVRQESRRRDALLPADVKRMLKGAVRGLEDKPSGKALEAGRPEREVFG